MHGTYSEKTLLRRCIDRLLDSGLMDANSLSVPALEVLGRCCRGIQELISILDEPGQHQLRLAAVYLCDLFTLLGRATEEIAGRSRIFHSMGLIENSLTSTSQGRYHHNFGCYERRGARRCPARSFGENRRPVKNQAR